MSKYRHPFRTATIAVYQRTEGVSGPAFMAWIEPVKKHPVYFSGKTAAAARRAARAFCNEQADKHEKAYQDRMTAREKRGKKPTTSKDDV